MPSGSPANGNSLSEVAELRKEVKHLGQLISGLIKEKEEWKADRQRLEEERKADREELQRLGQLITDLLLEKVVWKTQRLA